MIWIKSKWYDLTFFILPIILVLTLYPLNNVPQKIIEVVALVSLMLSAVHIGTNWTLLYRDKTFIRFDKFRYFYMAWFIIGTSIVLSLWDLNLFMSIYVYWGLWHFARQHWGIGMLYKGKAPFFDKKDYQIDKLLVHVLLFLPLLIQFSRPEDFAFYTITLYRFYLPEYFSYFLLIIYIICFVIWLVYSLYRYKKGILIVPAFLTFFFSAVAFMIIYFFVDNFLLMYTLISIPHSLQYIGLALHYHKGKNKNVLKYSRAKERSFFIKYWLFTVIYVLLAVFLVKMNEQLHSPFIYGLLSLTIFHFWVELFSWKAKYNPELKLALNFTTKTEN